MTYDVYHSLIKMVSAITNCCYERNKTLRDALLLEQHPTVYCFPLTACSDVFIPYIFATGTYKSDKFQIVVLPEISFLEKTEKMQYY